MESSTCRRRLSWSSLIWIPWTLSGTLQEVFECTINIYELLCPAHRGKTGIFRLWARVKRWKGRPFTSAPISSRYLLAVCLPKETQTWSRLQGRQLPCSLAPACTTFAVSILFRLLRKGKKDITRSSAAFQSTHRHAWTSWMHLDYLEALIQLPLLLIYPLEIVRQTEGGACNIKRKGSQHALCKILATSKWPASTASPKAVRPLLLTSLRVAFAPWFSRLATISELPFLQRMAGWSRQLNTGRLSFEHPLTGVRIMVWLQDNTQSCRPANFGMLYLAAMCKAVSSALFDPSVQAPFCSKTSTACCFP